MKHKLVCVIEGGVLQGCYSNWYDSLDLEVVLVDYDNISQGDASPTEEIRDIIALGNQIF